MTTIRVNERSKAGKMLLELARMLSKGEKGVKIIESEKEEIDYPISKNVPNEETLKILQGNDEEKKKKGMSLEKFYKEINM